MRNAVARAKLVPAKAGTKRARRVAIHAVHDAARLCPPYDAQCAIALGLLRAGAIGRTAAFINMLRAQSWRRTGAAMCGRPAESLASEPQWRARCVPAFAGTSLARPTSLFLPRL